MCLNVNSLSCVSCESRFISVHIRANSRKWLKIHVKMLPCCAQKTISESRDNACIESILKGKPCQRGIPCNYIGLQQCII